MGDVLATNYSRGSRYPPLYVQAAYECSSHSLVPKCPGTSRPPTRDPDRRRPPALFAAQWRRPPSSPFQPSDASGQPSRLKKTPASAADRGRAPVATAGGSSGALPEPVGRSSGADTQPGALPLQPAPERRESRPQTPPSRRDSSRR